MAGSPGAGKGTHGRRLGRDLGVPHIAAGDLLRDQIAKETPVGLKIKDFVDRGDYFGAITLIVDWTIFALQLADRPIAIHPYSQSVPERAGGLQIAHVTDVQ